jgi:putative endonuclease
MNRHTYYVYITTNPARTVLYTGMTNDLVRRLAEHYESRGKPGHFAGKYFCYQLLYWEHFRYVYHAIEREKQIKGWTRQKKNELISSFNPEWRFLNEEIQG